MALYIGLISGTSVDAVDAALLDPEREPMAVVATRSHPIPDALRDRLIAFIREPGTALEAWRLDAEIGEVFARAALELLRETGVRPSGVRAIGSHGQTVFHEPRGTPAFTAQLGDPNVIAERTGISTVADFRRRDMSAGGEGAPLAPAFHHAAFGHREHVRAVVNVGGIANLTVLEPGEPAPVLGFDTGPGNTLMDGWAERHLGARYDADGAWAASGAVSADLLDRLRDDDYLRAAPPKSTGREHFHMAWLEARLGDRRPSAPDVQRTLCELTAITIAEGVVAHAPGAQGVYVCGGGARNSLLMARLADRLAPCPVATTAELGVHPDWVEAAAFAWLAHRTLHGLAGNAPGVTGARRAVVLGGIYR